MTSNMLDEDKNKDFDWTVNITKRFAKLRLPESHARKKGFE
jgi:hypothetical protein